ncbi:MAG TPA: tRNA (N(6)-L-threonylcarbamoyladenosine(37)-C(2))-methylthiotransferase MtaB [Allosphingosinicella sp.]
MTGPQVITLGCRLNLAESDTIRGLAGEANDLVVINSCAVTQEAVRNTRQAIRRAHRDRPNARIVVTGCAAEIDPASFEAMPEVDRVVANPSKLDAGLYPHSVRPELVEGRFFFPTEVQKGSGGLRQAQAERDDRAEPFVSSFRRTRAFVAVQNGCDHRCTFCIIPYGRGPSRSVPAGLIVDGIKRLVDRGCAEVVLTGVDVTSYGPDLPGSPTLGLLVERILRHAPHLQRLRLSSLDSVEIDDRLYDIIAGEPRFMPHLHMSFQSGDDMILKRMKRRHSRAQAIETVQRIKAARPDVAIGADLIAGFPTETEEMAANSLALIDECDIVMGHIFPYSPRPGTPAARMPQLQTQAIKARAQALRAATARRRSAWLQSLVGTRQRVLFERGGLGHAENFAPVRLAPSGHPSEAGAGDWHDRSTDASLRWHDGITSVRITGVDDNVLTGAPA